MTLISRPRFATDQLKDFSLDLNFAASLLCAALYDEIAGSRQNHGGSDGTRTRGLCRDSNNDVQLIGFQRYRQPVLDPLRNSSTRRTGPKSDPDLERIAPF